MISLWLKMNCHFTDEEKEACISTIDRLLELANKARREGILSLEEDADTEQKNLFLKYGLEVFMSADIDETRKVLQNLIWADNCTGSELLKRFIILEGLTSIIQGENPRLLEFKLTALLGEKYIISVWENARKESQEAYKMYIKSLEKSIVEPLTTL